MKNYTDEINAAIAELGRIALNNAKENCPVRTGRLKNSIRLTESVNRATGINSALVGTNVEYAKFVEFGRRNSKPRNFLGGAAEYARSRAAFVFGLYIRGK